MSADQTQEQVQQEASGTSSRAARVVSKALADKRSLVRKLVLGEVIGERPAAGGSPNRTSGGSR